VSGISARQSTVTPRVTLALKDWPGKYKPALVLRVNTISVAEARANDARIWSEIKQQTAGVAGLELRGANSELMYLDASRDKRIVLIWSSNAGEQVTKARGGGSALVGVVATDVSWREPAVPAGVYLLWCVMKPSGPPRWEIKSPDMRLREMLPVMPSGLPREKRELYEKDSSLLGSSIAIGLENDEIINVGYGSADELSFLFALKLGNRVGDSPADGWFRIDKP
jgi:hypothetical protein